MLLLLLLFRLMMIQLLIIICFHFLRDKLKTKTTESVNVPQFIFMNSWNALTLDPCAFFKKNGHLSEAGHKISPLNGNFTQAIQKNRKFSLENVEKQPFFSTRQVLSNAPKIHINTNVNLS